MKSVAPSWDIVKPLIKASSNLSNLLNNETKKLIEQSNNYFSPLQDPLCLDFSSNRWFAGSREEGYSDWLIWIIGQIDDPKLVFKLLGINDDNLVRECTGITPKLKRELYVSEGHEGQTGRIDIIIIYETKILIDVEVKIINAESADIGKNIGYRKSLEKTYPKYKGKNYHEHKLLVTDAAKLSYCDGGGGDEGYKVLKWGDVCFELRTIVAKILKDKPLLSSLMLAFAGAIEQNLLGIPNVKSKRGHSELINYLQKILPEERTMEKNYEAEKLQFVKAGLSNYLDAQWAVKEFQNEIIKQIKEAVNKRLKDLGTAMKISFDENGISDDIGCGDEFARVGCTIGGFNSGLNLLYFFLSFEPNNLCVCVSMETQYATQRDTLVNHCKKVSINFENWEGNEIGLADCSIGVENFTEFKDKLNGLIDKWIEVWENVDEQFRKQFR
jgi:hypothetical protein